MLNFLFYLVFIISVGMAAMGIILSTRLREKYHKTVLSSLLYFQVFICTFGFYGIWGQVMIRAFLSSYVSPEATAKFSDINMLFALPFLVFAWLMLIKFSAAISGRQGSRWFISLFLLLNFLVIIIVGYFLSGDNETKPVSLLKIYFISMNFIYSLTGFFLIFSPGKLKPLIFEHDRKIISISLLLIMLLQCVPLLFYKTQPYLAIIFILAFFAGNTFLPFYFNYGIGFSAIMDETVKNLSFEEFCNKFEVSPRERDIVRELCNGLSNKEISEKLFISLQTVKDHTHRIYTKTNVRSRVQLINLVKEMTSK